MRPCPHAGIGGRSDRQNTARCSRDTTARHVDNGGRWALGLAHHVYWKGGLYYGMQRLRSSARSRSSTVDGRKCPKRPVRRGFCTAAASAAVI